MCEKVIEGMRRYEREGDEERTKILNENGTSEMMVKSVYLDHPKGKNTDDLINTRTHPRTWVRGELDKKSREIEL